jgi:hypothetical protein
MVLIKKKKPLNGVGMQNNPYNDFRRTSNRGGKQILEDLSMGCDYSDVLITSFHDLSHT